MDSSRPTAMMSAADVVEQFRDAIRKADLNPPDGIKGDGKLHRFATNGERADDAGWYVLYPDGIPAGAFGDWRSGIKGGWRADIGRALSPAEEAAHRERIQRARHEAEALKQREEREAAQRALAIWDEAKPAPADHPYLIIKGVATHGLRIYRGKLVIGGMSCDGALCAALRNAAGEIQTIEFIAPNGDKRFLPKGRKQGGYYSIGQENGVICVAEGFATGASVHEATGYAVAVAFDADNLVDVALVLRQKLPGEQIVLCGDQDASGKGQRKAEEAARSVRGLVAIPQQTGKDWNDIHHDLGLDAVKRGIEAARTRVDSAGSTSGPRVRLVCGSELRPAGIEWLWPGWLALGKLHICAGAPGAGKTTIMIALAATVTKGGRWPDGTLCSPRNVLIWSGEDDPEDTLLPRLIAMSGDPARVHFVGDVQADGKTRPFDPSRDMDVLLREALRIGNVALVCIDPIVNAVAGDSHKNTETRRALQPVVDLAARLKAAVFGISHFTKGTMGRDPVERVTGSIAFGALPRLVFAAARRPEEQGGGRIFVRAKANIGPDGDGYVYDLEQAALASHPEIMASRLVWGEALEGTARELLTDAEHPEREAKVDVEHETLTEEAEDFLRKALPKAGRVPARDVKKAALDEGITAKALRRARKQLGVVIEREGFGKQMVSYWQLPLVARAAVVPSYAHQDEGAGMGANVTEDTNEEEALCEENTTQDWEAV